MNEYTAEEVSELLSKEDPKMTLRTVRYYRQCKFIPDLPISQTTGKPVYTDEHIAHFRAIRTLSKTGDTLENIRGKLTSLNTSQVQSLANESGYYTTSRVIDNETVVLHPDVSVQLNRALPATVKDKMILAFSKIIKEELKND